MIYRIGINADGGDVPERNVIGAILAAAECRDYTVVLYGNEFEILKIQHDNAGELPELSGCMEIEHCARSLEALPAALNDLAAGQIQALITATDSKHLAAVSHKAELWSRPGRPALMSPLPTKMGQTYFMDAGATSRVSDPEVFLHWAELGCRFLTSQCGVENPLFGLYNIAEERGYPELAAIDAVLRRLPGYIGYLEPRQFVDGKADLWLMEGFIGNGVLKLLEAYLDFTTMSYLQGIEDHAAKQSIVAKAKQLFSYDAHLISPYLTESGQWVFRVHGGANAAQIAGAFMAACRYNLDKPMW